MYYFKKNESIIDKNISKIVGERGREIGMKKTEKFIQRGKKILMFDGYRVRH